MTTETQKPAADQFDLACEVNDAYRRMQMNVKYYGRRLDAYERYNRWVEVVVAVGTSGSVASLGVWGTTWGKVLFGILLATASILSVAKPIWNLSGTISRLSKLWSSYNDLANALERVVRDMLVNHRLRPELLETVAVALDTHATLASAEDPAPDAELLRTVFDEVNRELPMDRLWWPADPSSTASGELAAGTAPAPAMA